MPGPFLATIGLLVGLCGGLGWYVTHLLEQRGVAAAQLEQLQAVNEAALAAAGRLTAENQRLDATLAARGRAGAAIDARAGDDRRRAADALQSVPEWADGAVPAAIGGLLADGAGDPDRGNPRPAAAGADGAPAGAGVPGGP